jgi:hypothetical protein
MKTPISAVIMVIFYWLVIYGLTIVPHVSDNYNLNLVWLTVVVPNVMRLIVGSIPRLAVDRIFFMSASLIAMMITFLVNSFWGESKRAIEKYGNDRRKTLKLSFLLMSAFAIGALVTYFSGIDNSIYSNMGWESQSLTM